MLVIVEKLYIFDDLDHATQMFRVHKWQIQDDVTLGR